MTRLEAILHELIRLIDEDSAIYETWQKAHMANSKRREALMEEAKKLLKDPQP